MITVLVFIVPLFALLAWMRSRSIRNQPPRLQEAIPFVSNAWLFMTNKKRFITRLTWVTCPWMRAPRWSNCRSNALRTNPVVQCQLGPLNVYFITGSDNVPALFKSSFTSDPWVIRILERTAGYFPMDIVKFTRDDTGSNRQPRIGSTEDLPQSERIWHAMHRNYDETLHGPQAVNTFSTSYQAFFQRQLDTIQAQDCPAEVNLFDFLRQNMSHAATRAMFGPGIIDVNPGFIDAFWQYERVAEPLAFGLPEWLNKRGIEARNRMCAMCTKWFRKADREILWNDFIPGQDIEWEPAFGSPLSRGLARWGKSFNFSPESMGPVYTLFVFA